MGEVELKQMWFHCTSFFFFFFSSIDFHFSVSFFLLFSSVHLPSAQRLSSKEAYCITAHRAYNPQPEGTFYMAASDSNKVNVVRKDLINVQRWKTLAATPKQTAFALMRSDIRSGQAGRSLSLSPLLIPLSLSFAPPSSPSLFRSLPLFLSLHVCSPLKD